VDHAGDGEVARRKGPGYAGEVGPNGGGSGAVGSRLPQRCFEAYWSTPIAVRPRS
jgi:hypothetical protein